MPIEDCIRMLLRYADEYAAQAAEHDAQAEYYRHRAAQIRAAAEAASARAGDCVLDHPPG